MKRVAVLVAAALLTGGCDVGPSGEVIGNRPAGETECKDTLDIRQGLTYVLVLKSSASEVDQNDPHKSWIPVVRTKCVKESEAAKYPVGSRYMS